MEILRALHYQSGSVGLRQLARMADVHPHSAERFLNDLVAEGLVLRRKLKSRTWFKKNEPSSDWQLIDAVFNAADHVTADMHSRMINQRARIILPFIEEAVDLVRRSDRGNTHVT